MSEPNGRQKRAIENLAAALNECFGAAVEKSAQVAEQTRREVNARLDRQDDTLHRHDETLHRQNDTLRMIWTQCGGKANQRLPVDD